MTTSPPEIIHLEEYIPQFFPEETIPHEMAELIYDKYPSQIHVDFPSYPTGNQWRLTSQGWIGYIPLAAKLHLSLEPKVSLSNLFQMLDYAYQLDIKFLDDLFTCQSLQDYYNRLASILARKIMARSRKGLYRSYESYQEPLPYLRERVDINRWIRSPWKVNLECEYHEHTADILDNQILAWTLYSIGRSGLCSSKTLSNVRKAYHEIEGYVTTLPFNPKICINQLYHRLNEDYRPLHSLCRFFLEHSGPSHNLGDRNMIPFLIDMDHLFEMFVAEWLKKNLPSSWSIKAQERVYISQIGELFFVVDLVLVNNITRSVKCVLDTKYKHQEKASPDDISQVIAYADILHCDEAILIYPVKLTSSLDSKPGRIRTRSVTFDLSDDLEKSGQTFIQAVLF
jgi:5-methylcytosine-specific restriction enzyme subunit McrC